MKRVLFNGDAVAVTGFAEATHRICDVLAHTWDLHLLGINYWGDPGHGYPYQVYPANPGGRGDYCGLWRLPDMITALRPDVLVVHNDPWNVKDYVRQFGKTLPVVAFMPVDAKNCKSAAALNGLAMAIFYTQFGLEEARKGGYTGPACVVGLGVDRDVYHPIPQATARARVIPPGLLPANAFIVGNVNRNQPRKRMDLSVAYFAEWIKTRGIDDAYLYLHLAPTGDKGWDIKQLAQYYGISHRLITPKPNRVGVGVPREFLAAVYNSFSVHINTGVGEGFGLTSLEAMSCGIPNLGGDWAAFGSWAREGMQLIPCTSTSAMWNDINTIGGVPDRQLFIEALDTLYRSAAARRELGERGLALAKQPRFSWSDVGLAFDEALHEALGMSGAWDAIEPIGLETEPVS